MMKIKINIFTFITLVLSYYNVFSQNETQLIFKGTATGTNNYTVTVSATTYPSLLDAKEILVKVPNVNTTSVTITTINSNGVNYGTRNIYLNGNNLSGGELTVGIYHRLVYNSALSRWDLDKSGNPPVGTPITIGSGTGINVSGTYPSFTVTNTSPDQTVVLNNGTGISATGTYPNFTITNTTPDQSVTISNGTGIVVGGAYPTFTVTNSSPDVPVTLTPGTGMSITGTYPSYTVTNTSPSSGGTVTTFTITPNQGVSGTVTNPTTTPSAQIILGAITPSISVTSPISTFSTSTTTPKVIMQGSSSGTTTVTVPSTAGSYTLTLPPTDGNALEFLQTDGNGTTIWAPSTSSSQWTTSGNDIYYNTGNVGIDNSSPDAKLDIVNTSTLSSTTAVQISNTGNGTSTADATGLYITSGNAVNAIGAEITSNSTVTGGINNGLNINAIGSNSGYNNGANITATNGSYNKGLSILASGGTEATALHLEAISATTNKALIISNGNSGIGTESPSTKLHLVGTSGCFRYQDGAEGSGKILTSDANGLATWQSAPSAGVTTAVAPLSITTNTISIQTPTSGTVLRANGTSWTNSTYSVSNTFTANSILHATSTNTVGENTSFGFNGNQMYMGTTTPSTDHGVDFRWNNNAATYWRFYNPSTGTSSRNILRLYNQSYVLDFGINGINFTNSGLLRASTPFILFNAPTNENGLIYTSSTNGLIFAIGGTSSSNAKMYLDGTNGYVGIGTGTVAATARLHVIGSGSTTATESFKVLNSANDTIFKIRDDGKLFYKDGNQAAGKVLTSNAIGMATWTTPSSGSVSSVGISGGTTGLTFSGGPITTAGTFTTSGTLSLANGGTGETTANAAFNALSPNTTRGDITVRNATVNARLALGAAGKILRSDGTDLVYSTATYPNTTTANQILYSSATNTLGGSANLTYDGTTFSTPVASNSTSLTSPLIIGGSGTTQSLTYKTTTGVGTTGADHIFVSGNNGATEIARMTNAGEFLVGKTAPTIGELVAFKKNYAGMTACLIENANASGFVCYKVVGNQKTATLGVNNSAASSYGMIASNDVYIHGTTNLSFMAEGASAVIKWSTGSSTLEKMRLDVNGNLGIGTSTPQSKLDVEGGVAIGATYSGTTAAPTNGAIIEGLVGMGVSSPSAKLHLAAATSSVTPSMRINPATGTLRSITSGSINFHEGGELLEAAGADGWSEVIGSWGTPTISGGVGTPTYAVTSGSTDVNVKVEYTSSVSPADDDILFVITYEHALHRAGTVAVTNRNRAAALTPVYVEETTTGFTVKLAKSTADTPVWDQTRYWGFQVKN